MVFPRCVGLVNLANMMPVMQAVMKTPTMLCTLITTMASGQWTLVIRPPYPMVCWVSTLNRKAEVKSTTFSTQTA